MAPVQANRALPRRSLRPRLAMTNFARNQLFADKMNMSLLGAVHDRDLHVIVGSALHELLGPLRLDHAKIIRLQVYYTSLAPVRTQSAVPKHAGRLHSL